MSKPTKSRTTPSEGALKPAKFNPLALGTLAETMVTELLKQKPVPLSTLPPFEGPGVYAIYYTGPFESYKPIAVADISRKCEPPIYVGKAYSKASGKTPGGKALFGRLKIHATSIKEVTNLDIGDFWCRYLVTEDVFIPLCEKLLIERYRPIWNVVITGFGPKVVGERRTNQQISMWDLLHPGRPGRGAAPNKRFKTAGDVKKKLADFFQKAPSETDSS